jgi:hypothetical protein
MGKENRPKTDNLAWIKAILFPKKGKPVTSVKPTSLEPQTPAVTPPPAAVPSPVASPPPVSHPRVVLTQPAQQAAPARPSGPPPAKKTGERAFLPAFWTIASVLSMIVNIILVVVLLVLARELFTLKALVGDELLGGLYNNFVLMDEAHIRTTIEVKTEVPVEFTLPVQTLTTVQLTEDTFINSARVTLTTGGLNIVNAPTNIILPAGTNLPIALDISVPVSTTIPITLQVPVDIPLRETELHRPFVGLQDVVKPYYEMLMPDIKGPQDVPFCQPILWLCEALFRTE